MDAFSRFRDAVGTCIAERGRIRPPLPMLHVGALGRSEDAKYWDLSIANAMHAFKTISMNVKVLVRADSRGERVSKAAALGY